MQHPNFQEILDEVQNQRDKKRECRQIMDLCNEVQADTHETLGRVRMKTIEQKMRTLEFEQTLGIV